MKVNAFIFSILIVLEVKTKVSARILVVSKQCNEVYSKVSYQYVPYEETYETRNWIGARKYKTRINYKYQSVVTNHTRATCCPGFTELDSTRCRPFCSKNCGENGYCAYPEHCACEHGYAMHYDVDQCKPVCLDECFNGYCAAPDTCKCKSGYAPVNGVCSPVCTACDANESCVEPHVCRCNEGYSRVPHSRLDSETTEKCRPVCNRACVNGACVQPNRCKCNDGYASLDDDEFTCEPKCSVRCVHGDCTAPDTCTCHDGFRFRQNSTHVCEPFCPNGCVNAVCTAPGRCSCLDGYLSRVDKNHVCEPFCSSGCTHGRCIAPEKCACDGGYVPQNNNSRCAPVCTKDCVRGKCVAPNTCECNKGYKLATGSVSECVPSCKGDCAHGRCVAPGKCACDNGYKLQDDLTCAPVCGQNCLMGKCVAPNTCECNKGYKFANGSVSACVPSCRGDCAHGRCVAPEKCACDDGYELRDNLTCAPVCSQGCLMGKCVAPDVCECNEGYKLADGSVSECIPSCKDECVHGACTAPDECTCELGYEMTNSTDGSSKCIVICQCENGYCSDTNSTCQSCLEGYELLAEDNSTICTPRCAGGCENGQCVEPQRCECDEYYTPEQDALGNPICAHVCGGDCGRGSCSLDTGLCSCPYGWGGKHCEEPQVCSVTPADQSVYSRFNGSDAFEENENTTEIEDPWTGPICNYLCTGLINNTTKCANQSNGEQSIFVCFLDINSPCNRHSVVLANTSNARINYTILSCSIAIVLLAVTIVTIGVFIRKRRLERSARMKQSHEDNLIENENDGISLVCRIIKTNGNPSRSGANPDARTNAEETCNHPREGHINILR